MVQLNIPCRHEAGEVKNYSTQVPDYHHLSKQDINKLLDKAANAQEDDWKLRNSIHVRLIQGVQGTMCPRNIEGQTARNESKMSEIYVNRYHEGGTPELVDTLDQLLNWQ